MARAAAARERVLVHAGGLGQPHGRLGLQAGLERHHLDQGVHRVDARTAARVAERVDLRKAQHRPSGAGCDTRTYTLIRGCGSWIHEKQLYRVSRARLSGRARVRERKDGRKDEERTAALAAPGRGVLDVFSEGHNQVVRPAVHRGQVALHRSWDGGAKLDFDATFVSVCGKCVCMIVEIDFEGTYEPYKMMRRCSLAMVLSQRFEEIGHKARRKKPPHGLLHGVRVVRPKIEETLWKTYKLEPPLLHILQDLNFPPKMLTMIHTSLPD